MGSTRKQMRFQDEIDCTEKRRSCRIIALEEKKQKDRERNLALALERKSNPLNHSTKSKGKGKEIVEVWDDSSDVNKDEESPIKKGRKSKDLDQLISSIKELGKHNQNATASGTSDSSLNVMPLKNILENIIDFLQRKDTDELFAEPANLDAVKNDHEIVKQPMDFGTMRAKLHEGMYTNLNQFKRDIFLLCSNAKNASLKTSKYHQVAEDIHRYAKWIFEALNADPIHFDSELSLNERSPSRKPENGQLRIPGRVATKGAGRNNATPSTVPETEKRKKYSPPSKALISEVLNANKHIIQLNRSPIKYRESLMRFVKDLGSTAQKVAAEKLEVLKNKQLYSSASQEKEIVNTSNAGSVKIGDGPFQGNKTYSNDNNACATSLVGNFFYNNDEGGSSSNVFARVHPTSMISGRPQPRLSGNRNSLSGLSLKPLPCLVSESRPENSMSCMPSNNHTELSLMHQPRSEDTSNLSELSLVSQPRRRDSMYAMPSNNLTELSLMPCRPDSMSSMNPLRVSPHGPIPLQELNSLSLEIGLGGETNTNAGGGALIGQPEEAPPQIRWGNDNDNDQELNLDLRL